MSGAPKRSHDDGSHAITSKRPAEEGCLSSSNPGKSIQSVASDCHVPFGQVQDGRAGKIQWLETCDIDKRPSILPLHPISFSVNTSCIDHPIAAEIRQELRCSQDDKDLRSEIAEAKRSHGDVRVDSQVSETENNIRQENKDEKGLRSELTRPDHKNDIRGEKDNSTVSVPHMNRKEPKEHHRGPRHTENPKDGLDPWFSMLYGARNIAESGKDVSMSEEQTAFDAHENVGENRFGLKAEEKSRDKEQRRREDKHRDYADRDKERTEHRNHLQRCDTSNQSKEYVKEDREGDRMDRDRKDSQKDKERKDGEKIHPKREISNNDNSFRSEDMLEVHVKGPEKETLELKKHKELNNWKVLDRSAKDSKRERESDTDPDKHEKRSCNEKESEDGRSGVIQRDREAFGYGIQQRRRMLRSRGTPQSSNREPHFRSRPRDNEGSQGESDVSAITYKVGECVQELVKLWKEFEASLDGKKAEDLQNGPTLEIHIPAEHVSATNRQVRGGQLWGTDVYTNDSDLVAVLMHTGYCRPTTSLPPPAIQELRATIRVLPPQNCYYSTLRNNVRSRAWGAGIGCSFRVESCCMVKKGGGTIDLEPRLTLLSAVEPTLAPVSVERTMTTRAAASNALKRQRFVREVTIQYNLCNEPWIKYSINAVADKGLKRPLYTSARLKKGEVLYLESHHTRYELCYSGGKAVENGIMVKSSRSSDCGQRTQNHSAHVQIADRSQEHDSTVDVFRWSCCKKPLPQKTMLSIGIPLPSEHVEVLQDNLDWEDVQWSQTGVWVAGKEYDLVRIHFLSPN